mgnify:CR=1 FL=1
MKFIVIDGLDGCGKHTQAVKLIETLEARGKKVLFIDYPVYGSKGCVLVESYLHGELSNTPEGVNAYASSLFYAMDRYYDMKCGALSQLFKQSAETAYDFVVADRYTISSAILQAAKVAPEKRKEFCDWLFHTEYDLLELPKPDVCVYLKLENEVAQKLMTQRYKGKETKKDLHESAKGFLAKCYDTGIWAANEYGWRVLDCTTEDKKGIRNVDEIQSALCAMLSDVID